MRPVVSQIPVDDPRQLLFAEVGQQGIVAPKGAEPARLGERLVRGRHHAVEPNQRGRLFRSDDQRVAHDRGIQHVGWLQGWSASPEQDEQQAWITAVGTRVIGDQPAIGREALELKASGLLLQKIGARLAARAFLPRQGNAWNPKRVRDLLQAEVAYMAKGLDLACLQAAEDRMAKYLRQRPDLAVLHGLEVLEQRAQDKAKAKAIAPRR